MANEEIYTGAQSYQSDWVKTSFFGAQESLKATVKTLKDSPIAQVSIEVLSKSAFYSFFERIGLQNWLPDWFKPEVIKTVTRPETGWVNLTPEQITKDLNEANQAEPSLTQRVIDKTTLAFSKIEGDLNRAPKPMTERTVVPKSASRTSEVPSRSQSATPTATPKSQKEEPKQPPTQGVAPSTEEPSSAAPPQTSPARKSQESKKLSSEDRSDISLVEKPITPPVRSTEEPVEFEKDTAKSEKQTDTSHSVLEKQTDTSHSVNVNESYAPSPTQLKQPESKVTEVFGQVSFSQPETPKPPSSTISQTQEVVRSILPSPSESKPKSVRGRSQSQPPALNRTTAKLNEYEDRLQKLSSKISENSNLKKRIDQLDLEIKEQKRSSEKKSASQVPNQPSPEEPIEQIGTELVLIEAEEVVNNPESYLGAITRPQETSSSELIAPGSIVRKEMTIADVMNFLRGYNQLLDKAISSFPEQANLLKSQRDDFAKAFRSINDLFLQGKNNPAKVLENSEALKESIEAAINLVRESLSTIQSLNASENRLGLPSEGKLALEAGEEEENRVEEVVEDAEEKVNELEQKVDTLPSSPSSNGIIKTFKDLISRFRTSLGRLSTIPPHIPLDSSSSSSSAEEEGEQSLATVEEERVAEVAQEATQIINDMETQIEALPEESATPSEVSPMRHLLNGLKSTVSRLTTIQPKILFTAIPSTINQRMSELLDQQLLELIKDLDEEDLKFLPSNLKSFLPKDVQHSFESKLRMDSTTDPERAAAEWATIQKEIGTYASKYQMPSLIKSIKEHRAVLEQARQTAASLRQKPKPQFEAVKQLEDLINEIEKEGETNRKAALNRVSLSYYHMVMDTRSRDLELSRLNALVKDTSLFDQLSNLPHGSPAYRSTVQAIIQPQLNILKKVRTDIEKDQTKLAAMQKDGISFSEEWLSEFNSFISSTIKEIESLEKEFTTNWFPTNLTDLKPPELSEYRKEVAEFIDRTLGGPCFKKLIELDKVANTWEDYQNLLIEVKVARQALEAHISGEIKKLEQTGDPEMVKDMEDILNEFKTSVDNIQKKYREFASNSIYAPLMEFPNFTTGVEVYLEKTPLLRTDFEQAVNQTSQRLLEIQAKGQLKHIDEIIANLQKLSDKVTVVHKVTVDNLNKLKSDLMENLDKLSSSSREETTEAPTKEQTFAEAANKALDAMETGANELQARPSQEETTSSSRSSSEESSISSEESEEEPTTGNLAIEASRLKSWIDSLRNTISRLTTIKPKIP